MTPDRFGEIIRRERKRRGLTQAQLGDMIEATQTSVCMIERNDYSRGPMLETCNRLLDALGLEFKVVRKKEEE